MDRRHFLNRTLQTTVAATIGELLRPGREALALPANPSWREFEVAFRAEVVGPAGATRVWLPLPLAPDTDYYRSLGHSSTGNATRTAVYRDDRYGAEIFYAEWPAGEATPLLELACRFATRDRSVDLSAPGPVAAPPVAELQRFLEPTRLIRTDGIVAETAREITKGSRGDLEKARAIYEWIVVNTFRDPKVRGCGVGDIRSMLETRNLGGKCADLNALFVGLARAAGLPARDLYGMRVADSSEFKCLGRSGDVTKAQHCRAEFYTPALGWVPVDPADVRKVVLEENGGLSLEDPIVARARAKLFGAWEMNYLPFNVAHDVPLPNSAREPIPFLMYPQAETGEVAKDCLDPDAFRYRITSRELRPARA